MFKQLYLNNCFMHQDVTFDFETGMTAVVGKNETGKSLLIEMASYALWGAQALRGKSGDYKDLEVRLTFELRKGEYSVYRKNSVARLEGPNGPLASGTKPVNEKIRKLFGYSFEVFKVANVCNQSHVTELGDMPPTKRKQMVDQVVGLDRLDKLVRYLGDQRKDIAPRIQTLEQYLNAPTPPVKPDNYDEGPRDLETLTANVARYHQLNGALAVALQKPTPPDEPDFLEWEEEFRTNQKARNELETRARMAAPRHKLTKPKYTEEQLDEMAEQWSPYRHWVAHQNLLGQGTIVCPECDHEFPIAHNALENLGEVVEVPMPALNESEISHHRLNVIQHLQYETELKEHQTLLAELAETEDCSSQLNAIDGYHTAKQIYDMAVENFNNLSSQRSKQEEEFKTLQGCEDAYQKAILHNQAITAYNQELRTYNGQLETYNQQLAEIEELETKLDQLTKAKNAIASVRKRVKSYLVPSLNRVASKLLEEMTGGERSRVTIDEDFNIEIDGQRLETLSGSGQAVANLSIRIGLGQVLTNKVFSVFVADEVDAAMDPERANSTQECIHRLTGSINQVINVTHKHVHSDHLIELRR